MSRGGGWGNAWPTEVAEGWLPEPAVTFGRPRCKVNRTLNKISGLSVRTLSARIALNDGCAAPIFAASGLSQSPGYPRHSPKHCTSPARRAKDSWRMSFPYGSEISGGGLENPMPSVTLFGFPRSVYVQIAGLTLTHKEVPYTFRDLEPEMGTRTHLALHPFDRVPILQHADLHATVHGRLCQINYLSAVPWRKRRDKRSGPLVTPKAKVTPVRISPAV